jgi:phosphatidylserine decarboxylase
MRIDRAGLPFILGAFLSGLSLLLLGSVVLASALIILTMFFIFFFRDPDREVPAEAENDDLVVSPADGRIIHAGPVEQNNGPSGQWQQISIFLSPLNVHVNRTPIGGRILDVQYRAGRFLPAYRRDAATENERTEIRIDHNGQIVICRQVVGFLARRVVCRLSKGMEVTAGERLGVMKFGSRMDVFLPINSHLEVSMGQNVRGGESVIARLEPVAGPTTTRSSEVNGG